MQTKRFTIIGNPVEHSVSPKMFRAAYAAFPEFTYDKSLVQSAEEGIALFRTGYAGGNVTAPFKEDVLRLVDEVSDDARTIGAANEIIVLPNGALLASNTDYQGVLGSLAHHGVDLKGKECVLLGIGGAGKAAAYALKKAGAKLTIVNRTKQNAELYANKIECNWASLDQLEELICRADVIVNTLYPSIDIVDINWLHAGQAVLDASYVGSKLLERAQEKLCLPIDGRYWVYYQALPAFLHFTGMQADQHAMRELLGIN